MINSNIEKNCLKAQIELEVLRVSALENIEAVKLQGAVSDSIPEVFEADVLALGSLVDDYLKMADTKLSDLVLGHLEGFITLNCLCADY